MARASTRILEKSGIRGAWSAMGNNLKNLAKLNLSTKDLVHMSSRVSEFTAHPENTIIFFRPSVVTRVRLKNASKSSWRVRCWLMLTEPDLRLARAT